MGGCRDLWSRVAAGTIVHRIHALEARRRRLPLLSGRAELALPNPRGSSTRADPSTLSDWSALRQGLFSNLLNPKTGAFFVTVMPQFLMPGDSSVRLVVMVAVFEVMLLVWLTAYGHAVSRLGRTGPGLRVRRAMTRLSGAILIGLGARLAFERR